LSRIIKDEKRGKVDEKMFCQAVEESLSTEVAVTFNNMTKRCVREFKKEQSDNMHENEEV
jgi:hypothetical protein